MSTGDDVIARLDAVEVRLEAAAGASPPPGALTDADPGSGERWDRGQVWAHVTEFIPYWIQQALPVIEGQPSGEPVRFGRTKSDPERIGTIERDRREPVASLWASTQDEIGQLRGFLTGISPEQWDAHGLHPTRGVMTLSDMVEEFLVGHLEQHADQLEGLESTSR